MHKLTAPPPLQGGDGTSRRLRIRKRSASLNTTKALSPKAQERKKNAYAGTCQRSWKTEKPGRFVLDTVPQQAPQASSKTKNDRLRGKQISGRLSSSFPTAKKKEGDAAVSQPNKRRTGQNPRGWHGTPPFSGDQPNTERYPRSEMELHSTLKKAKQAHAPTHTDGRAQKASRALSFLLSSRSVTTTPSCAPPPPLGSSHTRWLFPDTQLSSRPQRAAARPDPASMKGFRVCKQRRPYSSSPHLCPFFTPPPPHRPPTLRQK